MESHINKVKSFVNKNQKELKIFGSFICWIIIFIMTIISQLLLIPNFNEIQYIIQFWFTISGVGFISFFLISIFFVKTNTKKIFVIIILIFIFGMVLSIRPAVIEIEETTQNFDYLSLFEDPLGGFKDLNEDEATLTSTYQLYFSLNEEQRAEIASLLPEFLIELIYDGFLNSRSCNEITNILNCYLIIILLQESTEGRAFISQHLDLFIHFLEVESTYEINEALKHGNSIGLTKESLFQGNLELKYYLFTCLNMLLSENFISFLQNSSLFFEIESDPVNEPGKIMITQENSNPFFSIEFFQGYDLEDYYYLTGILDILLNPTQQKLDIFKRLFDLNEIKSNILDIVEFSDDVGLYSLIGMNSVEQLQVTYLTCKIFSNIGQYNFISSGIIKI